MRTAFAIAEKDLRQRMRDRSAIILSVAAPLALALLFSLIIPSGATRTGTSRARSGGWPTSSGAGSGRRPPTSSSTADAGVNLK